MGQLIIPTSFVEFRIPLSLTQVFVDLLFEVTFRVDISITDQFVSSNARPYSSFVEFHISISSDRRIYISTFSSTLCQVDLQKLLSVSLHAFASKATKMTSYEQHVNNNSRMTSLSKNIAPLTGKGSPNYLAPL